MARSKRRAEKQARGGQRRGGGSAPARHGEPLPGGAAARRAPTLAVAALLALSVAAVYWPVARHEFVSIDDPLYFRNNPQLDGRLGLDDLRSAFGEPYFANWIPLTSLSIALDDALYGPKPAGFLVTNAALHALASILLFLALARLTGDWLPSACAAGIFALHPLHVESVAWASQRKDVLVAVFWMATLLAYARYVERPGAARYAAVALGLALALLSKPAAVTLPFALLLLDFWPLRRIALPGGQAPARDVGWRRALLEKLPLLALAALASGITLAVQADFGSVHSDQVPFWLRVGNAALAYLDYLRDSVWPSGLAVFYPYPAVRLKGAEPFVAAAVLGAVTVLCLWLARRSPALLVGWLWYLGTLVPMIGLVQVGTQARADRYMYLPLVGLSIAVLWGMLDGLRGARRVGAAAGAALCLALGIAAHAQVRHWRDAESVLQRALAVTENNAAAHQALGALRVERGELEAAEAHLREALRIEPRLRDARLRLGLCHAQRGRSAEARGEIERALADGADPAEAHVALGIVAERVGQPAQAVREYRKSLEIDPLHFEASNNLAWLLATSADPTLRDPAEAVRLAEAARARRRGGHPALLDTLAAAYAASGRYADAVRTQELALDALPPGGDPKQAALFRERLAAYRARSDP